MVISIKPLEYAMTMFCMVILMGCGLGTPSKESQLKTGANFKDRLDAAKAITVIGQRDDALSKLALSAAQVGRADIAKNALENIREKSKEDSTRSECALAFGQSTNFPDAFNIAENIQQSTTRDSAMAALAKLASETGNIDMIVRMLEKISDIDKGDQAAKASAIVLAQKGDIKMAKKIAETIRSKQIQNEALSQISTGH